MDGFYNYTNLIPQTFQEEDKRRQLKEEYKEELEAKRGNVADLVKGLAEPIVGDETKDLLKAGVRNLLKKGTQEALKKGSQVGRELVQGAGRISEDLRTGGVKAVLKREGENVRNFLKGKAEQQVKSFKAGARRFTGSLEDSPFSEPRRIGSRVVRRGIKPLERQTGKFSKEIETTKSKFRDVDLLDRRVKGIDEDIVKGLGDNPSLDDLRGGLLKQQARDVLRKKSYRVLGEDDMTGSQASGDRIKLPKLSRRLSPDELKELDSVNNERVGNLKNTFRTLPKEDRDEYRRQLKQSRKEAVDDPALSNEEARSKDIDIQEKLMNKFKRPPQPDKAPSEGLPEADEGTAQVKKALEKEALGKGEKDLEEDAEKKILKKTVKRTVEEEGEEETAGGGFLDPIADIVALGTGLSSLIGGLYKAHHLKMNKPKLPPMLQPSLQIGA
jgi:hypothetical protein